jgi:hypothetical protein
VSACAKVAHAVKGVAQLLLSFPAFDTKLCVFCASAGLAAMTNTTAQSQTQNSIVSFVMASPPWIEFETKRLRVIFARAKSAS